MKLSISNIAWDGMHDVEIFEFMHQLQFSGLEIAPTKMFPQNPYEKLSEAEEWKKRMEREYNFKVPSMQSIWFGRQENLFQSDKERKILLDYTKKAIDFAAAIECKNLVFGCPKNRNMGKGTGNGSDALPFFYEIGEYARKKNTTIGIEANPPIYHTNYINTTNEALLLIRSVASTGVRLNLDVGTMIQNGESVQELRGKVHFIQHVHISEPGLKPIEKREIHEELADLLRGEHYDGYVSIEMAKQNELAVIKQAMVYVKEIFG